MSALSKLASNLEYVSERPSGEKAGSWELPPSASLVN
jgi:hypothetical protein